MFLNNRTIFGSRKIKLKIRTKNKTGKYLDNRSRFKQGNPGRPKGIIDRRAKPFISVKQSILDAFNDPRIGGTEGLIQWVLERTNRRKTFYGWIMRLLPKTVELPVDGSASVLQELLDKYKELNANDLKKKATELADEVRRLSGN